MMSDDICGSDLSGGCLVGIIALIAALALTLGRYVIVVAYYIKPISIVMWVGVAVVVCITNKGIANKFVGFSYAALFVPMYTLVVAELLSCLNLWQAGHALQASLEGIIGIPFVLAIGVWGAMIIIEWESGLNAKWFFRMMIGNYIVSTAVTWIIYSQLIV